MLSFPKVEKGVRSAAGAVKRVRKVVSGVLLGAALASSALHPGAARALQDTTNASREIGDARARTELGALILHQGSSSAVLAGHRSHSSHSSHRSHASHYSSRNDSSDYTPPPAPAPKPKTTPPPAPVKKQAEAETTPAPQDCRGLSLQQVADEITRLEKLRDKGLITKAEFEARKKKLLACD